MKIFEVTFKGHYIGGHCLVIAKTKKIALKLAEEYNKNNFFEDVEVESIIGFRQNYKSNYYL